MRLLIGTALDMIAGGVKSHIESLRQVLAAQDVYSELVYPDDVTYWWKGIAVLRAFGSVDGARVELTKIRTDNVGAKVRKTISGGNFDLVHTHDAIMAGWAAKLSIPVVLTVHGPLSREAVMSRKGTPAYLNYLKEAEQQAYQCASMIIAVDTGQKEIIISDYNVPHEKVRVIYNAVDTDIFKPRLSQAERKKQYFLVPRRLVPKNGVHVAIEALRLIENMEVELWLAGDGYERPALENLAAGLNLTSKVRFLGSVARNDMINLINESAGIIVPSVPSEGVVEATSIAALEGMSMGKPVFATNVGGLAEIIQNGLTGFLFESGDANALGGLLRHALKDRDYSKEIGIKARDCVIANHSLEVWVKQVLEVYRDAIQAKGR